jgi:hypothetical protein
MVSLLRHAPLSVLSAAAVIGHYALQNDGEPASVRLIGGAMLTLMASAFSLLASPRLRNAALGTLGKRT